MGKSAERALQKFLRKPSEGKCTMKNENEWYRGLIPALAVISFLLVSCDLSSQAASPQPSIITFSVS
jgi:hypothetical protein